MTTKDENTQSPTMDVFYALTSGKALTEEESRTLVQALKKEARHDGWKAGFHQADTDALHKAYNAGRSSTSEHGVEYRVEEMRFDKHTVWELARHQGRHAQVITAYRHPTAAEHAVNALNHAARHEDTSAPDRHL